MTSFLSMLTLGQRICMLKSYNNRKRVKIISLSKDFKSFQNDSTILNLSTETTGWTTVLFVTPMNNTATYMYLIALNKSR